MTGLQERLRQVEVSVARPSLRCWGRWLRRFGDQNTRKASNKRQGHAGLGGTGSLWIAASDSTQGTGWSGGLDRQYFDS